MFNPFNSNNSCIGGVFISVYNYFEIEGVGSALAYPYDYNAAYKGITS
jgi:hypothetical protein